MSQDVAEHSEHVNTASRTTPPIPGLYIFPDLLESAAARATLSYISDADLFIGGKRDQVMLFGAARDGSSTLPDELTALLAHVRAKLEPLVPDRQAIGDLFQQDDLARQAIINLYEPGQGITPHVDLPGRYADGIVGVSLTGGCVMAFRHVGRSERHDVYLGPRSVYALLGEARWEWSHGIEGRTEDIVLSNRGRPETILRELRVSVTFRYMKEGADTLS